MDIELARTFLAVVETGSFLSAAEQVHVTQSTVSARIKSLEEQLRRPLFTRGKSGAGLTPAGRHFYRHAQAILRSWTQARLDVGLPEHLDSAVEIGAQHSLWDGYLIAALGELRAAYPGHAFKASMGYPETLIRDISNGVLDLAVMYRPVAQSGLLIERLFDDEFVLVTSDPDRAADPFGDRYIFVDWGPEFRADHALNFPALETPAVQFGVGTLGLQYLRVHPASGYFPARLIDRNDPDLRIVENAPRFSYAAYSVHPESEEDAEIASMVRLLKASAARIFGSA